MQRTLILSSTLLLLLCSITLPAHAQLDRTPVVSESPVDLPFLSSRIASHYTVIQADQGELHSSVMHVFGPIDSGIGNLWGLDMGANVRLSLQYGVTDRFSLELGRTRTDKVVDLTGRFALLRQLTTDRMPISASLVTSANVMTRRVGFLYDYSLADRMAWYAALPISRKFGPRFSLQISPEIARFNRMEPILVLRDPSEQTYLSIAAAARYMVGSSTSVSLLLSRPIGESEGAKPHATLSLDINTGGHVFQLFLSTSQALNPAWQIAGENSDLSDFAFRFGFNINRVFMLGD
ncbi:MAG: DUF5777 family beta-barrel protein [Balneolaceae bacterium]